MIQYLVKIAHGSFNTQHSFVVQTPAIAVSSTVTTAQTTAQQLAAAQAIAAARVAGTLWAVVSVTVLAS
jgi:hypothetical protein